MESTACDVQHHGQQVDVVDGLPPMPTNIKLQMPECAAFLQSLAANVGRDQVQQMLKASVDLRRAFDRNDYAAVRAVYRRGHGWIDWAEAGYLVGVSSDAMTRFARQHRGLKHGVQMSSQGQGA